MAFESVYLIQASLQCPAFIKILFPIKPSERKIQGLQMCISTSGFNGERLTDFHSVILMGCNLQSYHNWALASTFFRWYMWLRSLWTSHIWCWTKWGRYFTSRSKGKMSRVGDTHLGIFTFWSSPPGFWKLFLKYVSKCSIFSDSYN